MEKGRKNMLIAAGAAFAGGVAVTLTVLALAFCPAKRHGMWHGGWHRDMPRAEMRLPARHHPEGRFEGERRFGVEGRFDAEGRFGAGHRRGEERRLGFEHHLYRGERPEAERRLPPAPRADRAGELRRPGHPGFHPERALKHRFAERLQLTDEQKAQIEQFRKEDMAQMEPLFKQMDDLRAKADKLREENKARFESVLTDEQKEILAAMHERRAEMHKRRVSGQEHPAEMRERRAEMKESRAEMRGRRAEMEESRAEMNERRSAMQEQRVPADGQRDVQGKKQPERTQPAGEETVSAE